MKLTDKKRKDIIEAAIAEFRENGFLAAKTTSIAKRAGVSSRTLYKHFETKEALFDAITEIMIERNAAMAPVPYDPGRPVAEQLVEGLERYVAVITEPEAMGLTRMVISEFLRDLDRSRAFFAESAKHDYPVKRLIEEAMAAGALRKADPELATNQLLGLVKAFFFWPEFLAGEKPESEGALQDCVAMFLCHYKAKE
ncbi:transcriptional regulator, TetR family [Ruegeria intermedia]|uniref:Transcriptional regulator, TetR family n=1 Tax=Ruegeria intermedia TaxID=996115 RepID=A0A1M4YM38_9RHOB|nr:TetR/AcrR family transcriptional regulator [Ruegeria intermedia]SHF06885.1 transcriptional regulator, TetR family [Ruegeria intermedia]